MAPWRAYEPAMKTNPVGFSVFPEIGARPLLTIAAVAGTLDILAAFTASFLGSGRSPVFVLQFITSALLGKGAFQGGLSTAALGLGLHFAITLGWAMVFAALHSRWSFLSKRPIPAGLVYGAFIWIAMNLLLVPRTNIPRVPFTSVQLVLGIVFVVFLVGLPISILTDRFAHQTRPTEV